MSHGTHQILTSSDTVPLSNIPRSWLCETWPIIMASNSNSNKKRECSILLVCYKGWQKYSRLHFIYIMVCPIWISMFITFGFVGIKNSPVGIHERWNRTINGIASTQLMKQVRIMCFLLPKASLGSTERIFLSFYTL